MYRFNTWLRIVSWQLKGWLISANSLKSFLKLIDWLVGVLIDWLIYSRRTGETRGFAFVRFYKKRDAEDALDDINGRLVFIHISGFIWVTFTNVFIFWQMVSFLIQIFLKESTTVGIWRYSSPRTRRQSG